MRVATVDGLVTLFYDGSRELYNMELEHEWFGNRGHVLDADTNKRMEVESLNVSDRCKKYIKERLSWQQIIVVDGVEEIPRETFSWCLEVKRVIFANTVIRIGKFAFCNCENLVYIKWSIFLGVIGQSAFRHCNLSSVFIPPTCEEIDRNAFAYNRNLSILHVPQDAQLGRCVFATTTIAKSSSLHVDRNGWYSYGESNEMNQWLLNMNNDNKFSLHRACSSFQPLKEVLYPIISQKGLKAFREKNTAGITPSKYLKENPYTDLTEKEIIHDYLMKMMGEVE
ncbi:hypothetical protein CTEN210_00266 [Chaetoceros tenuissimus]|uniref:Leucine-rich repeat domain-containing protein n=1 Tax=Chaetoceros tenuissimus TaxID=426638 RepID=A0AAD3CDI0_9STRA|nr:hypothetical protein CTEN210_00266 [Chaetoceros tenuissimus]